MTMGRTTSRKRQYTAYPDSMQPYEPLWMSGEGLYSPS